MQRGRNIFLKGMRVPKLDLVFSSSFLVSAGLIDSRLKSIHTDTNFKKFYLYFMIGAFLSSSKTHAEEKDNQESIKFSIYAENLKTFIKEQKLTPLDDQEIKQLYAVQTNAQFTSQAAVRYNGQHPWKDHLHRDVQRAAVRVHLFYGGKSRHVAIQFRELGLPDCVAKLYRRTAELDLTDKNELRCKAVELQKQPDQSHHQVQRCIR